MLQEILNQEAEAKQFSQWIIANSYRTIDEEINQDKKSSTVTELLQNKPLFFLLEAIRNLELRWWISWFIFNDLEKQIKENYQQLDSEAKKLFLLKLKNFKVKQAQDLANNLNNE